MTKLERIILEVTPECWDAIRVDLGVREDASKREITHVWRDSLYEKYGLEKPTTAEERRRLALLEERARRAQEEYESMRRKMDGVTEEENDDKTEVKGGENKGSENDGVNEVKVESNDTANGDTKPVTKSRSPRSNRKRKTDPAPRNQ